MKNVVAQEEQEPFVSGTSAPSCTPHAQNKEAAVHDSEGGQRGPGSTMTEVGRDKRSNSHGRRASYDSVRELSGGIYRSDRCTVTNTMLQIYRNPSQSSRPMHERKWWNLRSSMSTPHRKQLASRSWGEANAPISDTGGRATAALIYLPFPSYSR